MSFSNNRGHRTLEERLKQRHFPFPTKPTTEPHTEHDKEGLLILGKPVQQGDVPSQAHECSQGREHCGRGRKRNMEAELCGRPGGRCTAPGNGPTSLSWRLSREDVATHLPAGVRGLHGALHWGQSHMLSRGSATPHSVKAATWEPLLVRGWGVEGSLQGQDRWGGASGCWGQVRGSSRDLLQSWLWG